MSLAVFRGSIVFEDDFKYRNYKSVRPPVLPQIFPDDTFRRYQMIFFQTFTVSEYHQVLISVLWGWLMKIVLLVLHLERTKLVDLNLLQQFKSFKIKILCLKIVKDKKKYCFFQLKRKYNHVQYRIIFFFRKQVTGTYKKVPVVQILLPSYTNFVSSESLLIRQKPGYFVVLVYHRVKKFTKI